MRLLKIGLLRCIQRIHQVTQLCLDFFCDFELLSIAGWSFDSFLDFLDLSLYRNCNVPLQNGKELLEVRLTSVDLPYCAI